MEPRVRARTSARTWLAVVLIALAALSATGLGQGTDYGVPDSVYFGTPKYSPKNCSDSVMIEIPVFLYSDRISIFNTFEFYWQGEIQCDTMHIYVTGNPLQTLTEIHIDNAANWVRGGLLATQGIICPTDGTELAARIHFSALPGDTFTIWSQPDHIRFQDGFNSWYPTFRDVTLSLAVPDTLFMSPGDADCSGSVSIADAVFLINYIFAGGCAPYDRNAADPDASCSISIADSMYLINYIFAGGNPPNAGCVVQL